MSVFPSLHARRRCEYLPRICPGGKWRFKAHPPGHGPHDGDPGLVWPARGAHEHGTPGLRAWRVHVPVARRAQPLAAAHGPYVLRPRPVRRQQGAHFLFGTRAQQVYCQRLLGGEAVGAWHPPPCRHGGGGRAAAAGIPQRWVWVAPDEHCLPGLQMFARRVELHVHLGKRGLHRLWGGAAPLGALPCGHSQSPATHALG
mmetsp:Transcript_49606/g.141832  ORF Transcript_49606/g.141832 Transcript_49606/m.141832 type:complete len:200 (+) Transcript_49606:210-809(+)